MTYVLRTRTSHNTAREQHQQCQCLRLSLCLSLSAQKHSHTHTFQTPPRISPLSEATFLPQGLIRRQNLEISAGAYIASYVVKLCCADCMLTYNIRLYNLLYYFNTCLEAVLCSIHPVSAVIQGRRII